MTVVRVSLVRLMVAAAAVLATTQAAPEGGHERPPFASHIPRRPRIRSPGEARPSVMLNRRPRAMSLKLAAENAGKALEDALKLVSAEIANIKGTQPALDTLPTEGSEVDTFPTGGSEVDTFPTEGSEVDTFPTEGSEGEEDTTFPLDTLPPEFSEGEDYSTAGSRGGGGGTAIVRIPPEFDSATPDSLLIYVFNVKNK